MADTDAVRDRLLYLATAATVVLVLAVLYVVASSKAKVAEPIFPRLEAAHGQPMDNDKELGVFKGDTKKGNLGVIAPESPIPVVTGAPGYDGNVQSSAPATATTTPAPSTTPVPDAIPTLYTIAPVVPGIQDQPRHFKAPMPLPAEHPYDPMYPIPFPNPSYKPVPPGGSPVTLPPHQTKPSKNKPAYHATPTPAPMTQKPDPYGDHPYNAKIIPNTLAPTISNEFKTDSTSVTEMPTQCPVMPPKGKLELAIKAWTNGKRSGPVSFEDGSVDMGQDGGWWDGSGSRCCDHYCRKVGPRGGEYWSCIAPQAPHNEFAHMKPAGHQCSMFGGVPIAKGFAA